MLFAHLDEMFGDVGAGVVHQHVDTGEAADPLADLGGVGHVADERAGGAAGALDLVRHLLELLFRACDEEDLRSEERREGTGWGSTCSIGEWPDYSKKTK